MTLTTIIDGFLRIIPLALVFLYSCSTEPSPIRKIRAHSTNFQGVMHAEPAKDSERYCQHCHGTALQGGSQLVGEGSLAPSCYTCHGKNWLDDDPEKSDAPEALHPVLNDKYHHGADFQTATTCANTACHGEDLKGIEDLGTPSCYLCHKKKWD